MESTLPRRRFIQTAATALVSVTTLPACVAARRNPIPAWPVGCRDIHLKTTGQPNAWSALKTLGAEITEVSVSLDLSCPALFHPSRKYTLSGDGLKMLQDDLAASGRRISAFALANQFDERLEAELTCVQAAIRAATQLGVGAIRIDLWPRKIPANQYLPFAISTCKRLCELAEGTPVRFGIENHGHTTNNPEFLKQLWDAVGSPRLGLTLDCANFYWFGYPLNDLYAIYEQVAPRVVHTHLKSIRFPEDRKNTRRPAGWEYDKRCCPIYDGDIDFPRLLRILRKADYRGDLCVEDESLGRFPETDRASILAREIAFLKGLRAQ